MVTDPVKEKINAGALILDVRSVDEFEDEHYPGAINIPLHLLPAKMDELGNKNRAIVLYCASGSRSAFGAKLLKESGFSDITNAGGLMDMPEV